MRVLLLVLFFVQAGAGALPGAPLLFVSVSGENRIDAYSIDGTSGALSRTTENRLDGSPGAFTHDPARRMLFVAYRPEGRLVNFRIDGKTGGLEEVSRTDTKSDPASLSMDVSGQYLLGAYDPGGDVSVHKLDRDRRLPILGQWTQTGPSTSAVVPHRSNAFVFVLRTTAERISIFRFNPGNGVLTPAPTPYFLTPDHTAPRDLAYHPSQERCYISNEAGNSVLHYQFNPARVEMVLQEVSSTVPEGFRGDNSAAEIRIRPGGKHLYVANRGHNSIAGFRIDPMNGRLAPVGQFATESIPGSFSIDPGGKFLYVAGEDTGRISAYKIDDGTGELRRFAEYDGGVKPSRVHAVNVP